MKKHSILPLTAIACLLLAAGLAPRSGLAQHGASMQSMGLEEESPAHAGGGEPQHEKGRVNWYHLGEKTPPLIASFVNLAVMIFIIWYFARKSVNRYFRERSRKIKSALDESETMKNEAEVRFKRISEKLDRIEQEMQMLKKEMIASAVAENERAVSEARGHAEAVRAGALRLIEIEKDVMVENLKREIAEMVIRRAGEIVKERIVQADHDRMTRETVDSFTGNVFDGGPGAPSNPPVQR
jgi:F0F1-type ATP synthase membrane subunit b/b'